MKKRVFSNFILYTVPSFIGKMSFLITIPILTFYLSKEAVGYIAIFNFCALPFTVLSEFGQAYVIYSLWFKLTSKERGELLFNMLFISVIMHIAAIGIIIVFSDSIFTLLIGHEWINIHNLFYVLILFAFSRFADGIFSSWIIMEQKAKLNAIFNSAFILIQTPLYILTIILTKNYEHVIRINVIILFLAMLVKVLLMHPHLTYRITPYYFYTAYQIGSPILLRSIFATIKTHFDKLLVIKFFGSINFASYDFSSTFNKVFNEASNNFGKSIDPIVYKQLSEKTLDVDNYRRMLFFWFYITIMFCGVIFLFGEYIIKWFTNNMFHDAYPLVLLSLTFLVISSQFMGNNIFPIFHKKTKFLLLLSIIEAIVSVPVTLLLIPLLGIQGGKIALWVTNLIKFLIYFLYKWKLYPVWLIEKLTCIYVLLFHMLVGLKVFTDLDYLYIPLVLLIVSLSVHIYIIEQETIRAFFTSMKNKVILRHVF